MSAALVPQVAESPLESARSAYAHAAEGLRAAEELVQQKIAELALARSTREQALTEVAARLTLLNELEDEVKPRIIADKSFTGGIVILDPKLQLEINEFCPRGERDKEPIRLRQEPSDPKCIWVNDGGWDLNRSDCAVLNLLLNNRGKELVLKDMLATGLIGPQLAHDEARRSLFARVVRGLNRIAPTPLIQKQGQGLYAKYWLTPGLLVEVEAETSGSKELEATKGASVVAVEQQVSAKADNISSLPTSAPASNGHKPTPELSALKKEPLEHPPVEPIAARPLSASAVAALAVARPSSLAPLPAESASPPSFKPAQHKAAPGGEITPQTSHKFQYPFFALVEDYVLNRVGFGTNVPAPRTPAEQRQYKVALSGMPGVCKTMGKEAPKGWEDRFRKLQIGLNPALAKVLMGKK